MLEEEARSYDIPGLTDAISSERERREIRVEVRKYKQNVPTDTFHLNKYYNGTFTDWTIYGSIDILAIIGRLFCYGSLWL